MWDLPGPGFEPVSPALTGGFLTTVPPGKPLAYDLAVKIVCILHPLQLSVYRFAHDVVLYSKL